MCTHVCKHKNDTCWNYYKMGVRGMKENGWGGEFMYLICCKNLCKCHKVLPPITTIKEKRKEKKNCKLICYDKKSAIFLGNPNANKKALVVRLVSLSKTNQ
jgi:hypothetical protein